MRPDLYLEKDPQRILEHVGEVVSLADSETMGLGFLPEQALRDGILRGKMLVLIDRSFERPKLVAYLLYSGVFPYAKVQQLATIRSHRQQWVASALIRALVTELERLGFMTLRADVASDLLAALEFYASNRFEPTRTKPGGTSRSRNIVVHIRELETDSLFARESETGFEVDLGIRSRSAREAPFFALDLNVYFDLARNRSQSETARRLFGAALAHEVRLTVADEFVTELRRNPPKRTEDPILQLALRLPRMPKADKQQLQSLQHHMHDLVFIQHQASGAGTPQAWSDAKHLAHAALARASAFITRDGAILGSRDELIRRFGIDVLSVEELLMSLPSDRAHALLGTQYGSDFVCADASAKEIRDYMRGECLSSQLIIEFSEEVLHPTRSTRMAIRKGDDMVACAVLLEIVAPKTVCRLFVHARPELLDVELYIDHLLDTMLRYASSSGVTAVELEHVTGQSTLNTAARARGFVRLASTSTTVKPVIGRPVTTSGWHTAVRELKLRTGLELPTTMPDGHYAERLLIKTPHGKEIFVSMSGLEKLLGPTLLIRSDQDGVIVPITRTYSDNLLGTNKQIPLGLVDDKDASFLSRRAYVNTPRAASAMRPGSPIRFYESINSGGRGCIVAVTRIANAEIRNRSDVPSDFLRRIVVESVAGFSSSNEVLITSFEELFVVPHFVPLDWLKAVGAVDNANLVTARRVPADIVTKILDKGWSNGRRR